jgi:hypothetical protein
MVMQNVRKVNLRFFRHRTTRIERHPLAVGVGNVPGLLSKAICESRRNPLN